MKRLVFIIISFLFFSNAKAQNDAVTKSGDLLTILIPAAALGSTFVWNDDHTKPTWQFVKAYGSAMIATQVLKHVVLKPRPDGSDNYSFPSSHTTSAFSGAGFIQRRYGWKYGIPSYILASYVGYTRIQAKKHDGWDVLAGATIGIGTAYIFTKPYEKKNVNVSLNRIKGGYLVSLDYTF